MNFLIEFRKMTIVNSTHDKIFIWYWLGLTGVPINAKYFPLELKIWFLIVRITWENREMIKRPLLIQWGRLNVKYFGQCSTLLHCWRPDMAVPPNQCNFAKYLFSPTFTVQSWCLLLSYLAYISIWLECKFFAVPALKSHPSFLITIHANLVVIRPTLSRYKTSARVEDIIIYKPSQSVPNMFDVSIWLNSSLLMHH